MNWSLFVILAHSAHHSDGVRRGGEGRPGVRARRRLPPGAAGRGPRARPHPADPVIERMVKVDLRTVTMDVPAQEVITRDNVTVKVNAVVYFRVVDPNAAVVNVARLRPRHLADRPDDAAQRARPVRLDDLLSERDKINQQLQRIIDEQTEPGASRSASVEVKDVELPQTMQRAMARQAEAEREKRAKVIHAEGEFEAASSSPQAAQVIDAATGRVQLRYLQTLTEIAAEKNTTIVFPLPIDLIAGLFRPERRPTEDGRAPSAPARGEPSSSPHS